MNFNYIIKAVEDNPYSAFFYTPSVYKKANSYLLIKPIEFISIVNQNEFNSSFKLIQKLIDKGCFGWGSINYEAGFLFEKKLNRFLPRDQKKLIQFYFFDKKDVLRIKSSKIEFDDKQKDNYSISDFRLNRTENEFVDDIKKIKHFIKEGDTYQVNYTIKGKFEFKGSYTAFLQKLIFNQSAHYTAFINNDKNIILSLSPELFFRVKRRKIESQPMKGTSRRGFNHTIDEKIENELKNSEKNLSENVMIVDLIRNDLGKISNYGSIKTTELFRIEKYESLFQMISKIDGKLKKNAKLDDVIMNIFPCGSVTGAPKIRTMEIIKEIEKSERGIYTGAIGLITPEEIKMNVAIRTITIEKKSGDGVMGLGSGIVWESDAKNEFEEVLLKSKFLTEPLDYFEIFETMRLENGSIKFLNDHIARMKSAADYFLFKFREKRMRKFLVELIKSIDPYQHKKFKLFLNKWGQFRSEISDVVKVPKSIRVIFSDKKINSEDRFRHFKTTNRKLYDDEYDRCIHRKFHEVLFLNEQDKVVEGSRTNLFIRLGKTWLTPPLNSGALPGIYRNYFIQNHPEVLEQEINVADLVKADEVILTNAVQGEIKVSRIYLTQEEFVNFN